MIACMTEPAPSVTVVVCTRNRSTLLGEACAALLGVEPPDGGWEVVIVDNSSTDDTPEVAAAVRDRAPDLVRLVRESTVGLSAARNRGVAEARGQLIAFLDDDAFPAAGWLVALERAFDDGTVACAGGPVDPLLDGELPAWFTGRFLPYLTVWDLGPEPIELHYNEYPRGANMTFRASAFEQFGGFSTRLGRTGRSLLSCEEIELCLRLERGGLRTVYVPDARILHTTPVDRLTPEWMERRFAAQGQSEAIVDWTHGGLRGLVRGIGAHRLHVREAASDRDAVGELFGRCQRRALHGYLRGAATAPLTVPRYRPPDPAVTLKPWP
jgi:glycosyltransferase involved in cell wall biosynthesis